YEGAFQTASVLTALWIYRHLGDGEADLRDPYSAISFLLLPGLILGAFALARTLPVWLLASEPFSLAQETAARWVAEGLGLFALVPPLVILATPWLIRTGLAGSTGWWDGHVPSTERSLGVSTLAARTALAGRLRRLTR